MPQGIELCIHIILVLGLCCSGCKTTRRTTVAGKQGDDSLLARLVTEDLGDLAPADTVLQITDTMRVKNFIVIDTHLKSKSPHVTTEGRTVRSVFLGLCRENEYLVTLRQGMVFAGPPSILGSYDTLIDKFDTSDEGLQRTLAKPVPFSGEDLNVSDMVGFFEKVVGLEIRLHVDDKRVAETVHGYRICVQDLPLKNSLAWLACLVGGDVEIVGQAVVIRLPGSSGDADRENTQ